MRFARTSTATAIAVLVGVTGSVGVAGTASADTPSPLSLPHYSRMAVDAQHGHVFVSGGPGSTNVAVTDLDGATVGTLDGEPGATSMVLSPDGGTLYIALPGSDAVSAVDTATLTETARYTTGTGTQDDPRYLAYTGGKLWFSYGAAGQAGIGSIDTSGAQPVVSLDGGGWYGSPALTASPSAPNVLVAGDTAISAAPLKTYDVSSGVPVQTASTSVETTVTDMSITPDGKDLVLATGAPYYHQVFKLSDLSSDGKYPTTYYPDAVAIAADGTVAAGVDAGTPNLYLFAQGGAAPLHTYDVRSGINTDIPAAGLAWEPDGTRLFAVTTDVYGQNPQIHVLHEPQKGVSVITLPGSLGGHAQTPLTINGTLTSTDAYAGGQTLHVTRTDSASPGGTPLPDVTVAADGSFSITDTPPVTGDATYTVTYAGDAAHAGTTATAVVIVSKAPAALTLSGPGSANRGAAVKLTGTLTSPAALAAGQTVHVARKDAQHTVALPDAAVAADGTFSFSDTPQVGGPVDYTVSYPGDAVHVMSSATREVQVSRAATAVSVTTNATTYGYGATARVTAHLGGTYNSRTVSLWAQPYGGTKTLVKTGTVDAYGNLAVNVTISRFTSFTASFAGDYRYAPATSAAHGVWSHARVSDVLKGYYTSTRIGSTTYRVYHHTTDPVTGAVVAPVKYDECLAFTAQVYTRGAWRTIATASCARTGGDSAAWGRLTGSHLTGYHYRFIAEYVRPSTDLANLNTYGSWLYFTFRT